VATGEARFERVRRQSAERDPADPPWAAGGQLLPDGARMVVAFTHTLLSGWGMLRDPRVSVWVEDADGVHVRTLLDRQADGLRTMAQWYAALGRIDTTTSGTKSAGSTRVDWDGTDERGRRVSVGDYHVCVEASRERGPRELVRGRVALGTERVVVHLADSGEIVEAAVYYSGRPDAPAGGALRAADRE